MEEKLITENESLLLIRQMIHTAKKEQKDDGRGWILFGWLLLLASVLSVLNIRLKWNFDQFFFWNMFGIITLVYFIYEILRFFFFKKLIK
jgi:hypothetical protein